MVSEESKSVRRFKALSKLTGALDGSENLTASLKLRLRAPHCSLLLDSVIFCVAWLFPIQLAKLQGGQLGKQETS